MFAPRFSVIRGNTQVVEFCKGRSINVLRGRYIQEGIYFTGHISMNLLNEHVQTRWLRDQEEQQQRCPTWR